MDVRLIRRYFCAFGIAAGVFAGDASATPPSFVPGPDLIAILHASRVLAAGVRGQGVRVGVISDGASNYEVLARNGILPKDVSFVGFDPGRGDEGDWMMQIVHRLAPQAKLGFCAGGLPAQTVGCARDLITEFRADIVVDDINPQPVFYFPTAKAIGMAEVAREHPQVLFFTGAGNNGTSYYEAKWTPAPLDVGGTTYLAQDFGRTKGEDSDPYETIILPPRAHVQVLLGTNADPDGLFSLQCVPSNPQVTLALLDEQGSVLHSVHGRCPFQLVWYFNDADTPLRVHVAVLLPDGTQPPRNFAVKLAAIQLGNGMRPIPLSYRTAGGAGNSAVAPGLVAVSAVDPASGWHDRYLVETFANSGPQCQAYEAAGQDRWMELATLRCVHQPAFVTPDRIWVAMPNPASGFQWEPFIGDSAAGPAAAGTAALLLSARVPPARIVDLLEHTATVQVDAAGWNEHYGYGLINADSAAAAAGVLPTAAANDPLPQPSPFRPTPAFRQDRALSLQAQQGDAQALAALRGAAESGGADAQAWLAMEAHDAGDDDSAARWALAAANQGEPVAQSFLGTLYNRGWGVPMDPRAAQAWWWRAARCEVGNAIYNMGTTVAQGRGAPPDPSLGYALMRAAELRGMHFPPMAQALAAASAQLNAGQLRAAEARAARFAADPASIPAP